MLTVGDLTRHHDVATNALVTTVEGLAPSTRYAARLESNTSSDVVEFHTAADIGTVTTRFATISDLHLGSKAFGPLKRLTDESEGEYTLRCARAAIREAQLWGAEFLLLKGDITEYGFVDHWDLLNDLIRDATVPIYAIPGNHDTFKKIEVDPWLALEKAGFSTDPVQVIDRPDVRIVLADTSIAGRGSGTLTAIRDDVIGAAADTDKPVFLAIHHNIQRTPVSWFWPPGISSMNARPVIGDLAEANRNVFISSGHTHRHRRHRLGTDGSIVFTEVGSTSDYPGTWAGYEVSNTAIRQVVRRIEEPGVVEWTERTRAAVGGIWPMWSQGALDDRCVDLHVRL